MMNSPTSPLLSLELKRIVNHKNVLSMRSRMNVLNALNESNQKYQERREENLRSKAIQEILTSEITYLQQLEIMMEYFVRPIVEGKLLDHALLSTLSENVTTLYNISGELVKELEQDPENIASAFYKLAPFFKLYSVYAYDYEHVLLLLQTSQENDVVLKNFINQQETRPEVARKLASLLITPIQRVPRYQLLLKQVLQHTPNRHREYNLLQGCLVEIEKSARHMNSLVAQNLETRKLLKLQKSICNPINLVKPGRQLIKEGALMRVSRRGNSAYRRYFILLSDILLYCKGDPKNSLTICCILPLNKCKLECVLSSGLFRITCLNEILLLYSEKDDSNSWTEAIQAAIKKYSECRQTLRKDSSSRKPLRHKNIHLFPSENISEIIVGKRKRLHEDGQFHLDGSGIAYLKTDNNVDRGNVASTTSNYFQLPIKTFKKLKSNKQTISSDVHAQRPFFDQSTNPGMNITAKENSAATYLYSFPSSSPELKTSSSTFKAVTEFFSYVRSSLKELFRFS